MSRPPLNRPASASAGLSLPPLAPSNESPGGSRPMEQLMGPNTTLPFAAMNTMLDERSPDSSPDVSPAVSPRGHNRSNTLPVGTSPAAGRQPQGAARSPGFSIPVSPAAVNTPRTPPFNISNSHSSNTSSAPSSAKSSGAMYPRSSPRMTALEPPRGLSLPPSVPLAPRSPQAPALYHLSSHSHSVSIQSRPQASVGSDSRRRSISRKLKVCRNCREPRDGFYCAPCNQPTLRERQAMIVHLNRERKMLSDLLTPILLQRQEAARAQASARASFGRQKHIWDEIMREREAILKERELLAKRRARMEKRQKKAQAQIVWLNELRGATTQNNLARIVQLKADLQSSFVSLATVRKKIVDSLLLCYPIRPVDQTVSCIVSPDLKLPDQATYFDANTLQFLGEETVSSALGFAVFVALSIAHYLSLTLPFRMVFAGSRSYVMVRKPLPSQPLQSNQHGELSLNQPSNSLPSSTTASGTASASSAGLRSSPTVPYTPRPRNHITLGQKMARILHSTHPISKGKSVAGSSHRPAYITVDRDPYSDDVSSILSAPPSPSSPSSCASSRSPSPSDISVSNPLDSDTVAAFDLDDNAAFIAPVPTREPSGDILDDSPTTLTSSTPTSSAPISRKSRAGSDRMEAFVPRPQLPSQPPETVTSPTSSTSSLGQAGLPGRPRPRANSTSAVPAPSQYQTPSLQDAAGRIRIERPPPRERTKMDRPRSKGIPEDSAYDSGDDQLKDYDELVAQRARMPQAHRTHSHTAVSGGPFPSMDRDGRGTGAVPHPHRSQSVQYPQMRASSEPPEDTMSTYSDRSTISGSSSRSAARPTWAALVKLRDEEEERLYTRFPLYWDSALPPEHFRHAVQILDHNVLFLCSKLGVAPNLVHRFHILPNLLKVAEAITLRRPPADQQPRADDTLHVPTQASSDPHSITLFENAVDQSDEIISSPISVELKSVSNVQVVQQAPEQLRATHGAAWELPLGDHSAPGPSPFTPVQPAMNPAEFPLTSSSGFYGTTQVGRSPSIVSHQSAAAFAPTILQAAPFPDLFASAQGSLLFQPPPAQHEFQDYVPEGSAVDDLPFDTGYRHESPDSVDEEVESASMVYPKPQDSQSMATARSPYRFPMAQPTDLPPPFSMHQQQQPAHYQHQTQAPSSPAYYSYQNPQSQYTGAYSPASPAYGSANPAASSFDARSAYPFTSRTPSNPMSPVDPRSGPISIQSHAALAEGVPVVSAPASRSSNVGPAPHGQGRATAAPVSARARSNSRGARMIDDDDDFEEDGWALIDSDAASRVPTNSNPAAPAASRPSALDQATMSLSSSIINNIKFPFGRGSRR